MNVYCINEKLINQLKNEGFKILGFKPELKRDYVFIYTPNNNLLYIYQDISGYHISLNYKPCVKNMVVVVQQKNIGILVKLLKTLKMQKQSVMFLQILLKKEL